MFRWFLVFSLFINIRWHVSLIFFFISSQPIWMLLTSLNTYKIYTPINLSNHKKAFWKSLFFIRDNQVEFESNSNSAQLKFQSNSNLISIKLNKDQAKSQAQILDSYQVSLKFDSNQVSIEVQFDSTQLRFKSNVIRLNSNLIKSKGHSNQNKSVSKFQRY